MRVRIKQEVGFFDVGYLGLRFVWGSELVRLKESRKLGIGSWLVCGRVRVWGRGEAEGVVGSNAYRAGVSEGAREELSEDLSSFNADACDGPF